MQRTSQKPASAIQRSGRDNGGGRQNTLPDPWARLAEAAGGVGKLAEVLGVTPMTVWRWGQGGEMSGPTRIAIATVASGFGVRDPAA